MEQGNVREQEKILNQAGGLNQTVEENNCEWTEADYCLLVEQLKDASEPGYRSFTAKLMPEVDIRRILGVRLPYLRKMADQIVKKDQIGYLECVEVRYGLSRYHEDKKGKKDKKDKTIEEVYRNNSVNMAFEEIMLYGFVIGKFKRFEDAKIHILMYLSLVDNWSTCDSFCSSLKFAKKELEKVFEFLLECLESEATFAVRFALVMLLDYYINEEYLERVFECIGKVSTESYYVRMAAAWAVSMCYLYNREKTIEFLKQDRLDEFTYQKSLQKIVESRKVSAEEKQYIRQLKSNIV